MSLKESSPGRIPQNRFAPFCTTPCETNQDNFQDMLGHLGLFGRQECSKKCWPCLERPRAPAKEDAERQGDQKKIVTPSCQVLCRSLAMYVLPVMDVLQIHDWTHDWICKFMTGALILINKPRGGRSVPPDTLCTYFSDDPPDEAE